MSFENAIIGLFAVATGVALLVRRIAVPYTVALVVAGISLGATHALRAPHLTKDLLYALILPGLIFEAAFHLDARRLWRNAYVIGLLAIPGVAIAGLLTALAVHRLLPASAGATIGFAAALVFGALIAATDPIAVVALFADLGAPRRLGVLIEAESLLNDGTAVAFYTVVSAALAGAEAGVGPSAARLLQVTGVGVLVGGLVGVGLAHVLRRVDEPTIEITLTSIAAYGSFVAAEALGGSGIIATVVAGLLCGNYAARVGMSATTRLAVQSFWEYVAFALNSLVFLLVGLEVKLHQLLAAWKPILIAWVVVTLVRALLVAATAAASWPTRARLPGRWLPVLAWGGLRGALSMVLALSLPPSFPQRELLVTLTVGVVVLSILVQGLTMKPLVRLLGVVPPSPPASVTARQRGIVVATRAALHALDREPDEDGTGVLKRCLEREYQETLERAEEALASVRPPQSVAETRMRRRLLLAEKDALANAYHQGLIDRGALEALVRERDRALLALDRDDPDA